MNAQRKNIVEQKQSSAPPLVYFPYKVEKKRFNTCDVHKL